MKKVMAFGTFDIYHAGHKKYLAQAKELGEYLLVVIARDETVFQVKNKKAINSEKERMKKVKAGGLADEVILGNLKDRYAVIEKYLPDVIALGYDQKADLLSLKKKLRELNLKSKIVRLKAYKPEIYKSSKLSMSKRRFSEAVFDQEIKICQKLNADSKGKGCNWGKCKDCGVIPLLMKLHKGIFIESKEDLRKTRKEIFEIKNK